VLLPAALAHALWPVPPDNGYEREVLGFSSHWYALVHATLGGDDTGDVHGQVRRLPRQGERDLTPPAAAEPRPNVVIVLLESVGHCYTSLHDPTLDTTPHLRRLAEEGAEFVTTRVPVSDTAKAFWTTFTGVTPDIQPDHAEAVLTDRPYESLATILARQGYRSAFFEMSKGAFECTPGLFANLGFDHAWFRENLQDESAHLGYFNGDDFRMIEPMFRWVDSGPGPFLLTMITSVSHDPYELPAWYGETAGDNRQRFLRAIRFGDDFLQRVDQELAARGLDRNTILCVIGDHGTDFGDRSEASRWMPFEPVIRVPWVLRWPGRIDPGRRVETPCSQLDVTPTLLRLLGYDVARAGFDGEDALDPALAPGRRFYFATWYARSPRGFVEGDRKLIYWPYRGTLFEYDLARDPGEERETILEGEARAEAVRDIERWRALSMVHIPARRFRERRVFEHWQTWCVGRYPRAHYVSQPAAASSERGDG
jgi:arylsulfatase A-like enzyme